METTRTYPRTAMDAFKGPVYACAIEVPPKGLLASGWFWIGGALSLTAWTLLWWVMA